MARRQNQNVNATLETLLTRGTPYLTFTNSKGVPIPGLPTFPFATCESFEISQANTAVSLGSSSEDTMDIVRRANVSKELTGTCVLRDFKPEALEIITGGKRFIDVEAPHTMTYTIKALGEFIVLDGWAKYEGFSIKKGAVEYDEEVNYVLSDGVIQINTVQPTIDALAVGDVITIAYTKKKQVRIEASVNDEIYAKIVFIGHRVTENENNLFKYTVNLAQLDPSTFTGHSPEDYAAWTMTFSLLALGTGKGLSKYYKIELATEEDLDE